MSQPSKRREGPGTATRIGARNRKAILDAAIKSFIEKGFDGASIAEIAKMASLPKANVYYYFGSKEAIYRTIIADLMEEWDKALGHLRVEREPADAITDYIRAKLDFTRKHSAQSRMFASEAVHGGRFISRKDRANMQTITLEKAKIFEAWAAAGKMDPVDPIHLFVLLWATTQYYADFDVLARNALGSKSISLSDYADAEEVITQIVLKGCGIESVSKGGSSRNG